MKSFESAVGDMVDECDWSVVGGSVTSSSGGEIRWAYTVGLARRNHPELIVFGWGVDAAKAVFSKVVDKPAFMKLEHGKTLGGLLGDGFQMKMVETH